MRNGICLITAGVPNPNLTVALLDKCGFEVWTPNSAAADDGQMYERALCLVIDMPRHAGVETLRLLRAYGVKTPALLVVDSGFSPNADELCDAWVLNVVPRTADPRDLLRWLESMCLTRKLLDRVRERDRHDSAALTAA